MQVDLIAHTRYRDDVAWNAYDFVSGRCGHADALAEFAGRLCYKSFDRPNPATAANVDYLANILRQQHFSVLEHASATFLVRGVSRALLAELSRHRHLSFSVVSQRYVDYNGTSPVIPPAIENEPDMVAELCDQYAEALVSYDELTARLIRKGYSRKQAREAARAVLPNAAPVDMVVTGNLRAWRDVLGKRHHVAADAEIQRFAALILAELRNVAPNSMQDIPKEPYGV
jgi:thymidylate synthase (FAD)